MLPATEEEHATVRDYYLSQSPDASVTFLQKVYAETLMGHRHDVWDVHSSDGRWWVITNPTNLYSQDQFPNMDLALTFHVGLCLRIPRAERYADLGINVDPFNSIMHMMTETGDAINQANDAAAYRTVGVRCRETLLALIQAAQNATEWTDAPPKRADFRAWSELICNAVLAGKDQRERRRLIKTLLEEAWTYANWLTHAQSATWHDAEAAHSSTGLAVEMALMSTLRFLRSVPEECPECGSHHLSPQDGFHRDFPEIGIQRPVCTDCGWSGRAVAIGRREEGAEPYSHEGENSDECGAMVTPLTSIWRPGDSSKKAE